MTSLFDPCFNCPVKKYDGKEGCPLRVCIFKVYDPYTLSIGMVDVETIILWEQKLTLEDIAVRTGQKVYRCYAKVKKWTDRIRPKLKEAGLLI